MKETEEISETSILVQYRHGWSPDKILQNHYVRTSKKETVTSSQIQTEWEVVSFFKEEYSY